MPLYSIPQISVQIAQAWTLYKYSGFQEGVNRARPFLNRLQIQLFKSKPASIHSSNSSNLLTLTYSSSHVDPHLVSSCLGHLAVCPGCHSFGGTFIVLSSQIVESAVQLLITRDVIGTGEEFCSQVTVGHGNR